MPVYKKPIKRGSKVQARKAPRPRKEREPKRVAGPEPAKVPVHGNREEWLRQAVALLRPEVRAQASLLGMSPRRPFPLLSVGYPPARTAELSYSYRTETGQTQIFLSPELGQGASATAKGVSYGPSIRALDLLLHELIHDTIGHHLGHQGPFQEIAAGLGLEGSAESYAGPELKKELSRLIKDHLGEYPHRASTAKPSSRQKNRQRKYVCDRCGKIIRSAGEGLQARHECGDRKMGKFILAD